MRKCMLILLLSGIAALTSLPVKAEVQEDSSETEEIYIDLERAENRLEEGMLCVPERFKRELRLYCWLSEAVEYRADESGDGEIFYCDLKEDVLYGTYSGKNRGFLVYDSPFLEEWEYPISQENTVEFPQDNYQLKVEGTDEILYAVLDLSEELLRLYPEGEVSLWDSNDNLAAYELIRRNEEEYTIIEYYPDFYVESDWEDMEREDDHFAGVSLEELYNLDYLKLPDELYSRENVYLNVASILKRYMEEQQIEDVFYFDMDEDIIARVTNMICTCRLRGEEHTLYIDIDGFNMKCHVYEVEE